jgi:peptide-methionine (R)-S-oxide reductase
MLDRRSLLGSGILALGLAFSGQAAAQAGAFPFRLSDAQWRKRLSLAAHAVLRRQSTEQPFSSPLDKEKRRGVYRCAGCDQPLFASATKFDSGTGWPSFFRPLPKAVGTRRDGLLGFARMEVHCSRCGGHLGHVFDDGPQPTGKRYCMNGAAMRFQPSRPRPATAGEPKSPWVSVLQPAWLRHR